LLPWAKTWLHLTVQIVKRPDDLHTFKVLPRRWVVERTLCATRRSAVFPVQPGGTRREVPGPDGLPGFRKVKGTAACQETSGRAQSSGTARWEARAIWRKLDCLKPNLQRMQVPIRRKDDRNRRRALPWTRCVGQGNLRSAKRCPARALKEMSGTPTSRYHVQQRRTWDCLRDASPMATEAP
jgi:hypothetical protein